MGEYTDVFLSKKIKHLLDVNGESPGVLVERALNRMVAQLPLGNDRRKYPRREHLRLVEPL